jgi:hypothetical protein
MTKKPKEGTIPFLTPFLFFNLEIVLYIHTKPKRTLKNSFFSHTFSFSKPHQTPSFLPFFFTNNITKVPEG